MLNTPCPTLSKVRTAMHDNAYNPETQPIVEVDKSQQAMLRSEAPTQAQPQVGPTGPDRVVVQLREEYLVPVKNWVEAGALLVHKGVETETQTVPVEVLHEEVDIQRIPVNQVLADG